MDKINICTALRGESTKNAFENVSSNTDISLMLGDKMTLPLSENGVSPSDYYTLSLNRVEYDKKLFAPAVVDLHFSVDIVNNPAVSTLKDSLLDGEVKVEVFDYDGTTRKYIAQNHYVHGINFTRNKNNKAECILKCYSIDKKITESRGCSVFTGQKFSSGIFSKELDKAAFPKECYSAEVKSLLLMGYDSTASNICRDGQHTEPDKNGEKSVLPGHDDELIHPYLVRYDESLYDFFARVAHRCGEFLYFDEGIFHLGLPDKTVEALVGNSFPEVEKNGAKKNPLCSYREIGGDADDDTPTFSADYLTGILENTENVAKFDMQHTSDDYLRLISSDDSIKDTAGWWIANKALSAFFTCSDTIVGIANVLVYLILDLIEAYEYVPNKVGETFDADYVNKDNGYATADNDMMQNLCNGYFHQIERLELKSERGMVTLDYSDYLPSYTLGSAFALNDGIYDSYVVSGMHGKISYDSQDQSLERENYVDAVPVIVSTFDNLSRVVVPPRGSISHFKSSNPMEALVTRNDDPLRLGRVKVRYPWQYDDGQGSPAQSPWIRLAVPMAGSKDTNGGFTMTPDVGEHVMVKYLSGNMERPYVDGSMYYRLHGPLMAPNMKPYILTGEKKAFVVASNKRHMMMISDTDDTNALEQLFPPLKVVMQLVTFLTGENYDEYMGQILGGNVSISDGSAMCMLNLSGDKRSITVSSNYGTVNVSAFTGITISAPNGDVRIKGKNVTIEAGNNLSFQSGANIRTKKTDYSAMAGSVIGEALSNALIGILKTYTGVDLSGCLDLSFLRCLWEIILRPVEGTLSLKSNRNVVVMAGRGMVNVPVSMLSKQKTGKSQTEYDQRQLALPKHKLDSLGWYLAAIDAFYKSERDAYQTLVDLSRKICDDLKEVNDYLKEDFKKNIMDNTGEIIDELFFLKKVAENAAADDIDSVVKNKAETKQKKVFTDYETQYNRLQKLADAYIEEHKLGKLDSKLKDADKMAKGLDDAASATPDVDVDKFPDGYKEKSGIYNVKDRDKILIDRKAAGQKNLRDFIKVQKRSALLQMLTAAGYKFYKDSTGNLYSDPEKLKKGLKEAEENHMDPQTTIDLNTEPLKSLITSSSPDFRAKIICSIVPLQSDNSSSASNSKSSIMESIVAGFCRPFGGGYTFNPATMQWEGGPQCRKLFNIHGVAGPRGYEEISANGNIMLSSNPAKTLHLNSFSTGWDSTMNAMNIDALRMAINVHTDLD